MDLRATFIKNLKIYRNRLKISQMKLAELCETSTSYIGEIEIGKKFPSIEMIQKIAAALQIAPYQLFMTESDITEIHIPLESRERLIERLQKSIADIIEEEQGDQELF